MDYSHPASLPSDIWASLILPRLDQHAFLKLSSLSLTWRQFFTENPRYAPFWKGLGFSDLWTYGQWLDYLDSTGVFLSEISMRSKSYSGVNGFIARKGSHQNNLTKYVGHSLAYLNTHPRANIELLTLDTCFLPFELVRSGEKQFHFARRQHMQARLRFGGSVNNYPKSVADNFPEKLTWESILPVSLTTLRFTGPYFDHGPSFLLEDFAAIGLAAPNLTVFEFQSLSDAGFDGRMFPNLRQLTIQWAHCDKCTTIHGSETLESLSLLHKTSAEIAAAFISSSPNLVHLNLGRVMTSSSTGLSPATFELSALKRLVTNGSALNSICISSTGLQRLEVFNCHQWSASELRLDFVPFDCDVRLHRVLRDISCSAQNIHVLQISPLGVAPEALVLDGPLADIYNHPGGGWQDHSKVMTAKMNRSHRCEACQLMVDPDWLDDHNLVCASRKLSCEICGKGEFLSPIALQRHRAVCPLNVSPCRDCGEIILNSAQSSHYIDVHVRPAFVSFRDCPNFGCTRTFLEQDWAARVAHERKCLSGAIQCHGCDQIFACLAACELHNCPRKLVMVMLVQKKIRRRKNEPIIALPPPLYSDRGDCKNETYEDFYVCSKCDTENLITNSSTYYERYHCVKCATSLRELN